MVESGTSTRRKFLLGASTAAATTGLSGCVGNALRGSSDDGSASITIWLAWGGYYEQFYSSMLDQFESEHPEYTVNYDSKGNYRETLNAVYTAAKADDEPDVAHLGSGATISIMDSGIFEPLGDLLGDSFDPSAYTQASLTGFEVEGKLRALPFGSSQIIMFYNRDHFEAAGLDPDSPPTSLAGVRSASEAVVNEGVAEYGITWPNAAWWPLSWLQEMGQPLTDAENGHAGEPSTLHLTSDAALRIAEWYEGLAEDGLYMNPGIEAWSPARQAFISGESAMHMTSVGSMQGELSAAADNDLNIGTAPLPLPDGEGLGHNASTAGLWARDGLEDSKREAVRELVLFLTNAEQQAYWHKSTGYFPTNREAIDRLESEGWYDDNPAFAVAKDQLLSWEETTATRGAAMGPSPEVTKIIAQKQDQMFQGDTDAATAMESAKREGERALEQYDRA